MAEGRMLKKAISTSRRLGDLKTDSARMLYTWIIPHLDVEGRFYADPSMIKGSIVPRVRSFTEDKIDECLVDMAEVGLIILYEIDGDRYLQIRKFEEHQNIKKDREAPSKIPAPVKQTPDQLPQTPDQLKSSTAQDKIREVKLSKDNNHGSGKPYLPVDNSKPETENQKTAPSEKSEKPETPKPKTSMPQLMDGNGGSIEKFTIELQEKLSEVYQRYPDFNIHRQVQLFLELNLKNGPRKVIIHSLNSILKAGEGIITARTVGKYLSTTFTCEHAKYNARDHEREAEQWKKPLTPAAKAVLEQLGLSGFGGGNG